MPPNAVHGDPHIMMMSVGRLDDEEEIHALADQLGRAVSDLRVGEAVLAAIVGFDDAYAHVAAKFRDLAVHGTLLDRRAVNALV